MIPVLDAADPDFGVEFIAACEGIGFVAVTGHGIDGSLFAEMRNMVTRLFELDDATKAEWRITPDNYRGFVPLGFFTPNRAEVNGTQSDQYEAFKLHWECPPGHPARQESPLYGPNRWLPHFPDLEATVSAYWAGCDRLGADLLGICADALGVDRAVMAAWHEAPLTNMTLLHYPAQAPPHTDSTAGVRSGIHPHKDTNVLTFLHPDPVGGLDVRSADGSWIAVECPPDAMLVNIGEMLELWSGGRFVATPHRVVNRSGAERYSFPFFIAPNHAVTVEPLVDCVPGFARPPMPVGALSAEVWRTNWPDERPSPEGHDLGALDR